VVPGMANGLNGTCLRSFLSEFLGKPHLGSNRQPIETSIKDAFPAEVDFAFIGSLQESIALLGV
jgi:hypothetical protein